VKLTTTTTKTQSSQCEEMNKQTRNRTKKQQTNMQTKIPGSGTLEF
jgi:hypothetical protein